MKLKDIANISVVVIILASILAVIGINQIITVASIVAVISNWIIVTVLMYMVNVSDNNSLYDNGHITKQSKTNALFMALIYPIIFIYFVIDPT